MNQVEVIVTESSYLFEKTINEYCTKLKFDKELIQKVNLTDCSLREVVEDLSSYSMFQETKLIVLTSFELLSTSKLNEEDLKYFKNYCLNPNPSSYLFIKCKSMTKYNVEQPLLNKMVNLREKLSSCLVFNELGSMGIDESKTIVLEFSKSLGLQIDKEPLELLLSYCNNDILRINSEIGKINEYLYPEKIVTSEIVNELVPNLHLESIFSLIDCYLSNNKKETLDQYNQIKEYLEPRQVISLLSRNLIQLLQYKVMISLEKTSTELAEFFEVSSGRYFYLGQQLKDKSNKFSFEKLYSTINKLCSLDYQVKLNLNNPSTSLVIFLLS
jgi:DNA polymerase III delta subunit